MRTIKFFPDHGESQDESYGEAGIARVFRVYSPSTNEALLVCGIGMKGRWAVGTSDCVGMGDGASWQVLGDLHGSGERWYSLTLVCPDDVVVEVI